MLLRAAAFGDVRVLQGLVTDGASLEIAAAKGISSAVRFLVDAGADVDAREYADIGGSTPLHHAVRSANLAIVKALLEAGADVNARDAGGRSPLHVAAVEGLVPMAKLLIARGADVNLRDGAGFNVTFLAREYGQDEILQLPGMPPSATASIEEVVAAHRLRVKRAMEIAELGKPKKVPKKGTKKGKKK